MQIAGNSGQSCGEQGQLIGLYNLKRGTLDFGGVPSVNLASLENNLERSDRDERQRVLSVRKEACFVSKVLKVGGQL